MSVISNIVSPHGDIQTTTAALNSGTPTAKLAYEFCSAFNTQVNLVQGHTSKFEVLSSCGIPMGTLYTGTCRGSDGDNETVYYFHSKHIVDKAKGSSRSDRSTRDSNSIKGLITSLKKNKEIPQVSSMHKSLGHGLRFAFTNVSNSRAPHISIEDKSAIDLIECVLLDKPLTIEQNEKLKRQYSEYQSKMKLFQSSASNSDRFNKGAKVIAICYLNRATPYYMVGEASYDATGGSGVTFQGDLKRYNSLKDVPEYAVDVAMINAYMQALPFYEKNNEFGLPRRDTYYSDIDIATGYGGDELWVAIPKTAP